MKVSKELLNDLNDLLNRSRDAQKGYVEASNHINHPELSKWMIDYSKQRQLYAAELDLEIKRLGGDADDSTSMLGELHRVWIDLKGQLTQNDPYAMLEECTRGEEKAMENYNEIFESHKNMPPETRDMLNRHRTKIKEALGQIKTLMKMYVPSES